MKSARKQSPQTGKRLVSYLRVSTDAQGIRGLGIEAQRNTVREYIKRLGAESLHIQEYVEVESGRRSDRPQLLKAIEHTRNAGATLVIAKLDRLSRDVHFLTGLERSGIEFVACDLPNANRLTITILAAVAEHEREMISERTKAALQVARERIASTGQRGHPEVRRLGNPHGAKALSEYGNVDAIAARQARANETAQRLKGILRDLHNDGVTSTRKLAQALNERGVLSPGGGNWHPSAVARTLKRLV